MSRARKSILSQAGNSLTHTDGGTIYSGLAEDQFSKKRLDEQQAHHKRLLQQRLEQKRNGGKPDPKSDPDHPENVRRRQKERLRQEKLAQKRLELKRKQAHQKAQIRARQRKQAQPETVTIARDGHIQTGHQELTQEERRAKLKARAELQRKQRREELEANYNPFDPKSKPLKQEGDIWDFDDETDAMLTSAGLLHEITATSRVTQSKASSTYGTNEDDDDLYSFAEQRSYKPMAKSDTLGSFGDLLNDIEGVDAAAAASAGSGSSRAPKREPILTRKRSGSGSSRDPRPNDTASDGHSSGDEGGEVGNDELSDLLNDIL